MTTPPWGHKPPPVPDSETYWTQPPPAPSERCTYWMRRLAEGSWHPNKYLMRECSQCAAQMTGVWIWEWVHILGPACYKDVRARAEQVASKG